jgi:hypothetical protein
MEQQQLILQAITRLLPSAQFSVASDGDIIWRDESHAQPTNAEIESSKSIVLAEYVATQYQRERVYPSWQDQLDNMFHNGFDVWKADIQAIKDKHPK